MASAVIDLGSGTTGPEGPEGPAGTQDTFLSIVPTAGDTVEADAPNTLLTLLSADGNIVATGDNTAKSLDLKLADSITLAGGIETGAPVAIICDDNGGAPATLFISNADSQSSGGDYLRIEAPDTSIVFSVNQYGQAYLASSFEVNSNLQSKGYNLRAGDESGTINLNAPNSMGADYDLTMPATQGSGVLRNNGSGALSWAIAGAVADIASPGSATAADCANKINELLAALRTAGLLAV